MDRVAAGGGLKNDKTRAMTFAHEGNVFITGEATDDSTFGNQTLSSPGWAEAYGSVLPLK